MKLIPDWLLSALSDGDPVNPHTSMSRLIAFLTVVVCIVLPGLTWCLLSLIAVKLLDFPGSLTGFMAAASSLALAMFAFNKRSE